MVLQLLILGLNIMLINENLKWVLFPIWLFLLVPSGTTYLDATLDGLFFKARSCIRGAGPSELLLRLFLSFTLLQTSIAWWFSHHLLDIL